MANELATRQEAPRVPALFQRFGQRYGIDATKVGVILKATAFSTKDGPPSNEQMAALLIVADQYKLNPFTKEIYAFPDKQNGIVPVVGVDGWNRIANDHPQFDGEEVDIPPRADWVKIDEDAKSAPESLTVRVYRKDRTHATEHTEYLDECYRPPFVGKGRDGKPYKKAGPWQSHTKRMLEHKARIQARRIAFGFAGIYDEDEAERIIEARAVERNGETVWETEAEPVIGIQGWAMFQSVAADLGFDAETVLANAEALGHSGAPEQMPSRIAALIRQGMEEATKEGPEDDPDPTEPAAAEPPVTVPDEATGFPDDPRDAIDEQAFADPGPEAEQPTAAKASPRQLSKIAMLMKERDCDVEGVRNWMRNQWGISSRAQLDRDQAGLLIEYLNNLPGRLALDSERGAA